MPIKITPQGEIVGGGSGHPGAILFALAKAVFGTDAHGNVTIPDDLTAAPVSFTNTSLVAEVNAKT